MSIRGIDTQIMINRSPDLARDASAMQKKPELQQEFLAAAQKLAAAHSQASVSRTTETEMENIRTDVDSGGNGAGGSEGEGKDAEGGEQGGDDRDMLVPPGNNVIDIKV